jgi:FG-GAP-like repeat
MDRRSFGKLLAGTVTAAGVHGIQAAESKPELQARDSSVSDAPPSGGSDAWELVILDAAPAHATETGGTGAGDIDGDGKTELIIATNGALLWYRPSTLERGIVGRGYFNVGIALQDIDRDGHKEIIVGKKFNGTWALCWYKFGASLDDPWTEHILDGEMPGDPHDVVFGDLDGDGEHELVANAMYCDQPGLFAYKVPRDPTTRWTKQAVQSGLSAEGTATGDLNGDGKDEIVSGPYWFSAPAAGAFSGQLWKTHALAPDFREFCRAAIIDVNGNGRPDVILVEDEYPDGRLAWFENRLTGGPEHPPKTSWIEHPIDAPLNFSHSLRAWRDAKTMQVQVLAGEMNEGGWVAPYNWNARLIRYTAVGGGKSWHSEILYRGEGTHEAVYTDLDGSGTHVIFGHAAQIIAKGGVYDGWVQMFRPRKSAPIFAQYKHTFVDRQKPYTGIDIHAVDVDGDGLADIVCGAWWYKNPSWKRHTIPGVGQIIAAYDLDKDGRKELIGIKAKAGSQGFYNALSSDLVWLKPIDLSRDLWEEHFVGTGDGDWPHGNTIAPLLPGGRAALVCGYHDGKNPPQIFEVPQDPKQHPWPKRVIADIPYGEEMIAYDLDGDGRLDIVAGPYWLENLGDGQFKPHLLIEPEYLQSANLRMISRIAMADINGNGRADILFTVENVDYNVHKAFLAPVGWLENTGSPRDRKFNVHIIDKIRSPHSISVADLDGDGKMEIIVGEHDPFKAYRSESRLLAYKQADPQGITWSRFPVDNRFEHHDGAKAVELSPGRLVILSHGWMEPTYVHIWERSS